MTSKIILVEGIPGSGKTTLINALLKEHIQQKNKIGTLINLSQLHTYKPVVFDEDNFYADKTDNLNHLSKILNLLIWCVSTANKSSKLLITIDTLHVTHCFRPGNISWTDVDLLDRQLAELDCKLIFLKAMPETIWERAILKRNEADELYLPKYQKRYGDTLEQVHQYYMTEQEKMEKLFENSSLNKITLSSEDSILKNQKAAYGLWQQ